MSFMVCLCLNVQQLSSVACRRPYNIRGSYFRSHPCMQLEQCHNLKIDHNKNIAWYLMFFLLTDFKKNATSKCSLGGARQPVTHRNC